MAPNFDQPAGFGPGIEQHGAYPFDLGTLTSIDFDL
ncbi:hypothetical protein ANO14919_137560 [Xylariales sp. No.14919]|nr:hypothetical protein ANO14919_137560 [Xylariales sp. No.14919]